MKIPLAFRWGKNRKEYKMTAKDWIEQHEKMFPKCNKNRNPYRYCYVCGKDNISEKQLYAAYFPKYGNEKELRLKIICKECAYKVAENVKEPKGWQE